MAGRISKSAVGGTANLPAVVADKVPAPSKRAKVLQRGSMSEFRAQLAAGAQPYEAAASAARIRSSGEGRQQCGRHRL